MIQIYLINFLFAVSTTIGMAFIPFLIIDNLGFSIATLALIEGSTEFISNILRLVTGTAFDRIKNKKMLFIVPTGIALFSKIMLFIPSSIAIVFAKMTERIANGAFAAPRDAFIGNSARKEKRGKAFSLLAISKTVGCITGPILVSLIVYFFGSLKENILIIISIATIINLVGLLLSLTIKANNDLNVNFREDFKLDNIKNLLIKLKPLLILSCLFFAARFNDGMISIFLKQQGFPEWFYLSTISFFNIAILPFAIIFGHYMDKKKTYAMLNMTILAIVSFNIIYFSISGINWFLAILGLIAWGMQRTGAQITFNSLLRKNVEDKFFGTSIGIFSIISGFASFITSLICGKLASESFYDLFTYTGIISIITLIYAQVLIKRKLI